MALAPEPGSVPRVKTEREYLFEIVEKQRLKE